MPAGSASITHRGAAFISSRLIHPSRLLSARAIPLRRICNPLLSTSPPPTRCGAVRPSPPFVGMVTPAPPSRYGVLWHTPHELTWLRDIILLAPSGKSSPSNLPASPNTPSRSRNSRCVRLQPHLYPSHGSTCWRYIDPPGNCGSVV